MLSNVIEQRTGGNISTGVVIVSRSYNTRAHALKQAEQGAPVSWRAKLVFGLVKAQWITYPNSCWVPLVLWSELTALVGAFVFVRM